MDEKSKNVNETVGDKDVWSSGTYVSVYIYIYIYIHMLMPKYLVLNLFVKSCTLVSVFFFMCEEFGPSGFADIPSKP